MADQMDIDPVKAQRVPFSEEFLHPVFPDMGHPRPDSGVDPRGRHRFCHGQQGDVLPFSSRRGAGSGDPLLDPAEIVQHKTAVSVLRAVNE